MDTSYEEKQNFSQERGDKPTDEALEQVQDQIERLIGQVQEKYDIGRDQAIQEAERLVSEYNVKLQAVKEKAVERVEEKTAQSPWKVIVLALASGFVLGFLLRPQGGCDKTE